MPAPCPELLFVAGPQDGQRAVLIKAVSVAGRGEACDVHVAEEFASRQHLRFENTPDGCLVEVLSSHGVRINGKTYKPPKRLLLDTGDVLRVGAVTDLLFVAAGDDPAEALAAYRKDHPAAGGPRQKKEEEPVELLPAPEEAVKERAPTAPLAAPEDEEARKALQHRVKMRKYAILGGVYGAGMVALFAFLIIPKMFGGGGSTSDGVPDLSKPLSESLIRKAVRDPLVRSLSENQAAEELREAQAWYARINDQYGYLNLQKCVKYYKLHLAHLKPRGGDFADPDDSRRYDAAMEALVAKVVEIYDQAWRSEKARDWPDATAKWELLQKVLPEDPDWDKDSAYAKVVANVRLHAAYTRSNEEKRR
jgi:hypothetical protein